MQKEEEFQLFETLSSENAEEMVKKIVQTIQKCVLETAGRKTDNRGGKLNHKQRTNEDKKGDGK